MAHGDNAHFNYSFFLLYSHEQQNLYIMPFNIFVVLPIMATNGMFERSSWKLIWVNVSYWVITLSIMGGIICAWQ